MSKLSSKLRSDHRAPHNRGAPESGSLVLCSPAPSHGQDRSWFVRSSGVFPIISLEPATDIHLYTGQSKIQPWTLPKRLITKQIGRYIIDYLVQSVHALPTYTH